MRQMWWRGIGRPRPFSVAIGLVATIAAGWLAWSIPRHEPSTEVATRQAIARRCLVAWDEGKSVEAAGAFVAIVEEDPAANSLPIDRRLFWTIGVDALLEMSRVDEAERRIEAGLLVSRDDGLLVERLAAVAEHRGELAEAESLWRTATRLDEASSLPWLHLGRLALSRGESDSALRSLDEAARLAPNDPEVAYHLGLALRSGGRVAEANRELARASHLRSGSRDRPRGMDRPH